MAQNIQFRLANQADIPVLQELITVSARRLSVGYYSPEQIESAITYVFGVDTQLIIDQTYFVAEFDRKFVGCGGWSKRKTLFGGDQFKNKAPDPYVDSKKEPARIRAFFIHPDWGRRGIGRGILNSCSAAARSEGFTRFELGSTLPGVPFYAALGFKELGKQEIVFPDGVRLPIIHMDKLI